MIKKIFLLLCVLKTYEFMTESERRQIIELIKREVIPAIGCTEPIAVALCVAKATETLGAKPEKIKVLLKTDNILERLYNDYLKTDYNITNEIEESIEESISVILKEYQKKKEKARE